MDTKSAFPYLGRTVAYNNSNWEALYQNLRKDQRRWGMLAKVLTKSGAVVWSQEMIYKTVVQTVLPYGSKIWVAMGEMLTVLEGFHHWVARKTGGKDSSSCWRRRMVMATSGRIP